MVGESKRLTLAEHLGMTQIDSSVQKSLFGVYEVPTMQFLTVGMWLFLKGAAFGRARSDRLDVVAKMFVGLDTVADTFAQLGYPRETANREDLVLAYLKQVSDNGIYYYRRHCEKEPESLLDLWLTSFCPPEFDFRDLQKMKKLAKSNIRLGVALQKADAWLFVGISLGAMFPELTGKIWRQQYEKHDQESWASERLLGIDIPENFTPLPLEEMEQKVLAEVTSYVTEYFPELVDPLSLRLR